MNRDSGSQIYKYNGRYLEDITPRIKENLITSSVEKAGGSIVGDQLDDLGEKTANDIVSKYTKYGVFFKKIRGKDGTYYIAMYDIQKAISLSKYHSIVNSYNSYRVAVLYFNNATFVNNVDTKTQKTMEIISEFSQAKKVPDSEVKFDFTEEPNVEIEKQIKTGSVKVSDLLKFLEGFIRAFDHIFTEAHYKKKCQYAIGYITHPNQYGYVVSVFNFCTLIEVDGLMRFVSSYITGSKYADIYSTHFDKYSVYATENGLKFRFCIEKHKVNAPHLKKNKIISIGI